MKGYIHCRPDGTVCSYLSDGLCSKCGTRVTTVVNMKDLPTGWERDPLYVYGGRGGPLGNPFKIGTRDSMCDNFQDFFYEEVESNPEGALANAARKAAGRVLVCFCKPKRCHLDTVAEWLNMRRMQGSGPST